MLKKIIRVCFVTCAGIISVIIISAIFLPDTYREIFPYRFCHVLTNSMEPFIRTNSLVLVKMYNESIVVKENDIIIFFADRFGEKIVIMHRFSHTEVSEEKGTVYKTHPEGSDTPDMYETTANDILGVYLWHIPYAGKIILFLKSPFALLWICEIIVILLIKSLISAKWKEKEMITEI